MRMKYTNLEIKNIIEEALNAASKATSDYLLEHPNEFWPCGFAWVSVKPARGPFVKVMKDMGAGKTDEYEGGFSIWNPSRNPTQWMDAKVEGARVFAEHLRLHGVKAVARSRID